MSAVWDTLDILQGDRADLVIKQYPRELEFGGTQKSDDGHFHFYINGELFERTYWNLEAAASFLFWDNKLPYASDLIRARLRIGEEGYPEIVANGDTFIFNQVYGTGPLPMITQCIEHHPNSFVSLEDLQKEIRGISTVKYISQKLKNSIFDKNQALSPFILTKPRAICVKTNAIITYVQFQQIQKVSVKQ